MTLLLTALVVWATGCASASAPAPTLGSVEPPPLTSDGARSFDCPGPVFRGAEGRVDFDLTFDPAGRFVRARVVRVEGDSSLVGAARQSAVRCAAHPLAPYHKQADQVVRATFVFVRPGGQTRPDG